MKCLGNISVSNALENVMMVASDRRYQEEVLKDTALIVFLGKAGEEDWVEGQKSKCHK